MDDLQSLAHWEHLLGHQARGLIVFVYEVVGHLAPLPENLLFAHQSKIYALIGVRLEMYVSWARQVSPKWKTMAMPGSAFRQFGEPLQLILKRPVVSGGDFEVPFSPPVEPEWVED